MNQEALNLVPDNMVRSAFDRDAAVVDFLAVSFDSMAAVATPSRE